MKKGFKTFLSIIGALALLAGVGVGVYYGNDKVHSWTDEQIDKWKSSNSGDSSSSVDDSTKDSGTTDDSGKSETITSSDGKLGLYFPTGHTFFKASVNDTKTCIATISPANASCKTLNWTTSDSSCVAIASATTESGGIQTLTLMKIFSGEVTISVASAIDSKVSTSFKVNVNNFITSASFSGLQFNYDGTTHKVAKGEKLVTNGYYFAVSSDGVLTCSIPSLDDNCELHLYFAVTTALGDFATMGTTLTSSNKTSFSHGQPCFQTMELDYFALSTSGTSLVTNGNALDYGKINDIPFQISTLAYVAPTSVGGVSDISY